ncbi:hypothetical protein J8273_4020 [Carpediemonas membranifera]|uniref:Uncharacterized protein n=1 Tax=Carpediemonas membranifera TaxID=201153 RepID=A0A8J6E2I9_9EUKA|nr:hypothetical protein J8273_4020 [Carpediemonas membranifera]|eukprot:KAG9394376.1 hypothetical protein J8273_4020 [Carpediemonas membranifera]
MPRSPRNTSTKPSWEVASHEFTTGYLKEYIDKRDSIKSAGEHFVAAIQASSALKEQIHERPPESELEMRFRVLLNSVKTRIDNIRLMGAQVSSHYSAPLPPTPLPAPHRSKESRSIKPNSLRSPSPEEVPTTDIPTYHAPTQAGLRRNESEDRLTPPVETPKATAAIFTIAQASVDSKVRETPQRTPPKYGYAAREPERLRSFVANRQNDDELKRPKPIRARESPEVTSPTGAGPLRAAGSLSRLNTHQPPKKEGSGHRSRSMSPTTPGGFEVTKTFMW